MNQNYDPTTLLYLIEKCPQAVSCKCRDDQYPIHKAINSKYSHEVITKLADVYEDGLKEVFHNQLPLHIALDKKYDSSTLLYLVKKYPQSASSKYKCGQFPIHKAIEKNCSVEVITKITEYYKKGLYKRFNGDLPIHVAISNRYDSAILICLVENSL
jgi:hypothetical protein